MKIIKFVSIILLTQLFMCCNFAPGSYPYAETYKINIGESELIRLIENFKNENPQYCVPTSVGLIDGRKSSNDYWYHVYFYYENDNKILNTWIRQDIENKEKTIFAFHAINDGLILGWTNHSKLTPSDQMKETPFAG